MNKTNEPLAEMNKRKNTNYLIISDEKELISISLQILQMFFKKRF